MSLVEFSRQLLESAKMGQTDIVQSLMSNGASFTTDKVRLIVPSILVLIIF